MKIDVENSLISKATINESNFFSEGNLANDYYSGINKKVLISNTLIEKKDKEQAQKNIVARKRIDELIEKRRLKDLLDDSEDW